MRHGPATAAKVATGAGKAPAALSEALRDFYTKSQLAMDRQMRACGASIVQTRLLCFVAQRDEPRSVDIADAFHYAPRTVTEALDSLERNGLIVRTPSRRDRRAKIIEVTERGREVIAVAEPAGRAFAEAVFATLDREERVLLAALLGKLTDRLDAIAGEAD